MKESGILRSKSSVPASFEGLLPTPAGRQMFARIVALLIVVNCIGSSSAIATHLKFEGHWELCQKWQGRDVCERFVLLQKNRNICGGWEYWATNAGYDGNLQAIARTPAIAQWERICGTSGSRTQTECQEHSSSPREWERANGLLFLCDGQLYAIEDEKSLSAQTCSSAKKHQQGRGMQRKSLDGAERKRWMSRPWMKSCLAGSNFSSTKNK